MVRAHRFLRLSLRIFHVLEKAQVDRPRSVAWDDDNPKGAAGATGQPARL